ncbi:MAG: hypothetical protein HC888_05455 [Candidatus Competibacteraceae bacterium]|nr:hypothetical protein [Candidatus Competibacteraceae bacterium]
MATDSKANLFANLLARYLGMLPGVFADHQDTAFLPADEDGLSALAEFLDAEERAARGRVARIDAISRQIDELAWGLYRTGVQGDNPVSE